mmetsp:Transcript_57336/g.136290  ORF Transcript_57336/g.136290 Transcript_57336/m.136290 type:complete len:361 (+) Transcript_57336:105-1187(+)
MPIRSSSQVSQPTDAQAEIEPQGRDETALDDCQVEIQLQKMNNKIAEMQKLLDGMQPGVPGAMKSPAPPKAEDIQVLEMDKAPSNANKGTVSNFLEAWSPWVETETAMVGDVEVERKARMHKCSHASCFVIYLGMMCAYTVFVMWRWLETPVTRTFESAEADLFGGVDLDVSVDCSVCNLHRKQNVTYRIFHEYAHGPCETPRTVYADSNGSLPMCNGGSVGVWIGNISEGIERVWIRTSANGVDVMTPLEFWHEKTILFGMTVRRNSEDCEKKSDCSKFSKELYLANMVYDGKVDWGDDHWAGAKLNIQMLEYAQVYTEVPSRTIPDLLSDIGGASGMLVFGLGLLRKLSEVASPTKCW